MGDSLIRPDHPSCRDRSNCSGRDNRLNTIAVNFRLQADRKGHGFSRNRRADGGFTVCVRTLWANAVGYISCRPTSVAFVNTICNGVSVGTVLGPPATPKASHAILKSIGLKRARAAPAGRA